MLLLRQFELTLTCLIFLLCASFRPPTVFEVISDLWNSSTFNPIAPASECHFDFQEATDCSYDLVAGLTPATPQRVEDIFTSMRSDLLRIISRWEQSGQGEGGRDQEDDDNEEQQEDASTYDADEEEEQGFGAEQPVLDDNVSFMTSQTSPASAIDAFPRRRANIGTLGGRPARALQSRAAFLNGRPSYLLYFWEVADTHQLLQSSLQRLSNHTRASDASQAPSTSGGSRSRQRPQEQQQTSDSQTRKSLGAIARSITDLAESNRQSNRDLINDRAQDRDHEKKLEEKRQEFEERKIHIETTSECRTRCFNRRAQLTDLARQYRRSIAEINPRDNNSKRL